jgi:hypothetical protein
VQQRVHFVYFVVQFLLFPCITKRFCDNDSQPMCLYNLYMQLDYNALEVLTEGLNLWQKVSTYHNYGQCCVISLYRFHSCSKIEPVHKILSPDHIIVTEQPDGLNIMLRRQKGICNFQLRPSVEENLQTCARQVVLSHISRYFETCFKNQRMLFPSDKLVIIKLGIFP